MPKHSGCTASNLPASEPAAQSKLGSRKVSRPLTAFYSHRPTTVGSSIVPVSPRNPEAEEAQSQIHWFEQQNELDKPHKVGYPKIFLDEAFNFQERFSEQRAVKKG